MAKKILVTNAIGAMISTMSDIKKLEVVEPPKFTGTGGSKPTNTKPCKRHEYVDNKCRKCGRHLLFN